ncbi:MAG: M20/M25/M40 family metallo-hydrolase [Myxococcota bacterium]|jgi:hypothetical protein|nr:M20/M25/M40 family metallo-hydrolase [Myxococcota bacterium]
MPHASFTSGIVGLKSVLVALVLWTTALALGCADDSEKASRDTSNAPTDTTEETGGDTGSISNTGDSDTQSASELSAPDPQRILEDISYLADDERAGREASTPGNEQALEYLEERLAEAGIPPLAGASYRRSFTYPRWTELRAPTVAWDGEPMIGGRDFDVVRFSPSADVTAEVVFVGWGLSVPPYDESEYPDCPLPEAGYDELEGLDLTGKIVLRFLGAPPGAADPRVACPQNPATGQQPAASLVVMAPGWGIDFTAGVTARSDAPPKAPVLTVRRSFLEERLPQLGPAMVCADVLAGPSSFSLGVTAQVEVETKTQDGQSENIVGVIPGTDPLLRSQIVFVTGHVDHVGSELGTGVIYNGADDNASGTSVALELARVVAAMPGGPKRTVVFAAWNAEEVDLCGSCAYVDGSDFPMTSIAAVLNFDAVGAGMTTGVMAIGGAEAQNKALLRMMRDSLDEQGLSHAVMPLSFQASSDHACFYEQGVPAMTFQTLGNHPFAHTENDTVEGISLDVLQVAAEIGWAALEPMATGREDQLASEQGQSTNSNLMQTVDLKNRRYLSASTFRSSTLRF